MAVAETGKAPRKEGDAVPEVIEKELSANDVGETGAHQSGPYVGTSRTVPDFFPELDLTRRDPQERLVFLDSTGRRYEFEFRYWTVKDEYHLSHMTGFFRDHGVSSGDTLILRRDEAGTLHVAIRPEGELAAGTIIRRDGAWDVRTLPDGAYEPDGPRELELEPATDVDPEEE